MAERLADGAGEESLVAELVRRGSLRSDARAEVGAAARHPAISLARPLALDQPRLHSLLDVYSALHRQSGQRLERRADLPPREFFGEYYAAQRPVVLRGLMDDWPAMERWRPECLLKRYGHVRVEVMDRRESNPRHDLDPEPHRRRIRLGTFLRRILRGGPSNDCYLTGRNLALARGLKGLRADLRFPRGYLGPTRAKTKTKLWLGPAGTLTAMHHDDSNVLLGQVHGRKRVYLAPSFEIHRIYNQHGVWSAVDPAHADFARWPLFASVDVQETVIEPGELLFIPVGWWHQVHALEVSVSVTFQDFARPGGNTVWRLPPVLAGPTGSSSA